MSSKLHTSTQQICTVISLYITSIFQVCLFIKHYTSWIKLYKMFFVLKYCVRLSRRAFDWPSCLSTVFSPVASPSFTKSGTDEWFLNFSFIFSQPQVVCSSMLSWSVSHSGLALIWSNTPPFSARFATHLWPHWLHRQKWKLFLDKPVSTEETKTMEWPLCQYETNKSFFSPQIMFFKELLLFISRVFNFIILH